MLKRDSKNKLIGGVCAGIAKHFDVDPAIVRILTVISFFLSGSITFWSYFILWAILPKDEE